MKHHPFRPSDRLTAAFQHWSAPIAALILLLRLIAPGPAAAGIGHLPTDPLHAQATRSIGQDFPDPSVLVVGGMYYAYSTNTGGQNIPVMYSTDLSNWSPSVDALPKLPGWARWGRTWAPAVVAEPGVYRMYYSPTDADSGRQCISVAVAASPEGPFQDTSSAPLVCQLDRGGSIDPYVFSDLTGSYLIWKSEDNAFHRPTNIWARRLDPQTGGFVPDAATVRLLTRDAHWQAPSLEGPAMIVNDGIHYLFYGANAWDSAGSGIGYATCLTALGPCVDRTTSGPWMAGSRGGRAPLGPQGPTFFADTAGVTRLGFAAWTGPVGYPTHGRRALWTAPLDFQQLWAGRTPAVTGLEPDFTLNHQP
jgi:hypothetical protein